MNFLVVYFDERTSDEMSLCSIVTSESNNLTKSSWNDSLSFLTVIASHHGMSFAATCLSISEDSSVVTI